MVVYHTVANGPNGPARCTIVLSMAQRNGVFKRNVTKGGVVRNTLTLKGSQELLVGASKVFPPSRLRPKTEPRVLLKLTKPFKLMTRGKAIAANPRTDLARYLDMPRFYLDTTTVTGKDGRQTAGDCFFNISQEGPLALESAMNVPK